MARTPVVIEINNYEIKGLAFRSGLAGRSFFQAESMFLNPQLSTAQQAAQFVAERYPGSIGVHFNVPYESLFTRELSFPFADRRKVREVLPFELEPLIPNDLADVVYDSYLTTNALNQSTRAIVAGARKDVLIRYLDEFRQRDVTVLGIYTPHDALYRLHPFIGLESCIMLHVSRLVSVIVIVLNNEWRFARVMPVGYDWLIAKLRNKWKIDSAEIHRILLALPASLEDSAEVEDFKKAQKITNPKFKALAESVGEFTQVISRELRSKVVIPESEIEKAYRSNIADFSLPEMARVSHILLLTRDPASGRALSADEVAALDALAARIGVQGDRYNPAGMAMVGL